MSLQTDAEEVERLANLIAQFEAAKALASNPGALVTLGTILITQTQGPTAGSQFVFDAATMQVPLSGDQAGALFAQEAAWQTTIKNLTAPWTP